MESKGRNIGGWAYLVEKLQALGVSRRMAVHILNEVFREISLELKRGRYVDLGFGCLKKEKKRLSKKWLMMDDEPMQPYTVELTVDGPGSRLPEMFFKTKWGWAPRPLSSGFGEKPAVAHPLPDTSATVLDSKGGVAQ